MYPPRPFAEILAVLVLAGGLAIMGCGGGSGQGEGAAPASQEQREATAGDRGGQDGEPRREESEGRTGQDGEPTESGSSQSTSTSQSSSGQSSSITQSSNGGSSASSSSSSTGNGQAVKTFSGTGISNLTFNVEQPSRLIWTHAEGRRFSAKGGGISIDSRAGRGEVALEAGRYEDVRVSGGSWTIVVRPR